MISLSARAEQAVGSCHLQVKQPLSHAKLSTHPLAAADDAAAAVLLGEQLNDPSEFRVF